MCAASGRYLQLRVWNFFHIFLRGQFMLIDLTGQGGRLGILVVLLAGCSAGPSEPTLVEGGGTVTYKGAPLPDALVTFIPNNGPLAMGKTDMSGKFKLATGTTPGVAVGPAAVTVAMNSAGDKDDTPKFQKTDDPEARQKMQEAMMKRMQSPDTSRPS